MFSGWDKVGTLISKFEEKSWDIDIKKITVSHCHHIACNHARTLYLPIGAMANYLTGGGRDSSVTSNGFSRRPPCSVR